MSGLVVVFLFDGIIKLIRSAGARFVRAARLSVSSRCHHIIDLVCAVLFAIPRTALLGALLMTALLGGAISTHVRIESPLFSHTLFGVYLGLIAWGGIYLREPRLRALLPLRS
jgi:hypothetical protein